MRLLLFVTLLFFIPSVSNAQLFEFIQTDSFKIPVHYNEMIGMTTRDENWETVAYGEYPIGVKNSPIFSANFLIAGYNELNRMFNTGERYGNGYIWLHGPSGYFNDTDSIFNALYKRVWKVSQNEIIQHVRNYKNEDYTMPEAIKNWPAHGRQIYFEREFLAPFIDVNENDRYEPELGDYPAIKGDQTVLFLLNDNWYHGDYDSDGISRAFEVVGMAYTIDDPNFQNTAFLHYKVKNTSSLYYQEVRAGMFYDADIGRFDDDYAACDTNLNLFYMYQADSIDDGPSGYGINAPASGMQFLSHPLFAFGTHKMYAPSDRKGYYEALQGKFRDGTSYTYGGLGYGGDTATRYFYSGNPLDSTGWNEFNGGFTNPRESNGWGGIDQVSISKNGGQHCFDFAIHLTRGKSHMNSIEKLKDLAAFTMPYYSENLSNSCSNYFKVSLADTLYNNPELTLFPNPTSDVINLRLPKTAIDNTILQIFSINGELLLEQDVNSNLLQIDVEKFPAGVVFVRILKENELILNKKVLIYHK